MNNKKHWTYRVNKIAFLVYRVLQLGKRGDSLLYQAKRLIEFSKDVWYHLMSLYYQRKGTYGQTM